MKLKKVSVIIPTYNRQDTLKRAIETCISQTYKDIEIIIVDDTKKSQQDLIDSYHDDRIVYVHNANPQGSPIARNIGIERATGEYIAFLDDDDEWLPEKIEKQLNYMLNNPNCPIVICYSDDRRRHDGRISKPPKIISHKDLVKGFNLSSTSSYLCRAFNLEQVKVEEEYFDVKAPSGQEYDLALRVTQLYDIHCIPEILMIQHKTEGQISQNWGRKVRGQYFMMYKWGHEYSIIEWLKRIGLVGLFFSGYIFGDAVMYPINFFKELHEGIGR